MAASNLEPCPRGGVFLRQSFQSCQRPCHLGPNAILHSHSLWLGPPHSLIALPRLSQFQLSTFAYLPYVVEKIVVPIHLNDASPSLILPFVSIVIGRWQSQLQNHLPLPFLRHPHHFLPTRSFPLRPGWKDLGLHPLLPRRRPEKKSHARRASCLGSYHPVNSWIEWVQQFPRGRVWWSVEKGQEWFLLQDFVRKKKKVSVVVVCVHL